MASSGSFETSVCDAAGSNYLDYPNRIRVEWSSTPNISSNSSTIYWSVKPTGGISGRFIYFYLVKVVLGDVTVLNTGHIWGRANGTWSYSDPDPDTGEGGNWRTLSGSFTLSHNADGTKKLTGSAQCTIYVSSGPNSTSSGYSVDLPTIPRASDISGSTGDMNSPIKTTISSVSSSFRHTLRYTFGSESRTIASKVANSFVTWIPPLSLASQVPNATVGTGMLYCDTYNGDTLIGTKSCTLTLNVPSSVVPNIDSFTSSIASTSPPGCGIFVKNNSTVKWTATASGSYGSTIKKCVFQGPSLSSEQSWTASSYTATSSTITSSGTLSYTVTVTDSRGRTATKSGSISVSNYTSPRITNVNSYRCDTDGTYNSSGQYVTHKLNASFSTLNNANTIKIIVYSKQSTDSVYGSGVTIKNDSSGTNSYTYTYSSPSFGIEYMYDFKFVISDSVGNSSVVYSHVGSKSVPINISKDNNALAIGGFAQSSTNGRFDCRWEAHFASAPITDSDKNLKKNIEDLDVDIIGYLRPVKYNLIDGDDSITHYGFVAQDVEQALDSAGIGDKSPGIVHFDKDQNTQECKNYALAYEEFIPFLVKKCQELQQEVNILKAEIKELK